jgi:hypothetical protein
VIAPDARDRELECGKVDKQIAAILAKLAVFAVGKLAIIMVGVLAAVKDVDYFLRPQRTIGCSTTLLISAKIAELTPIAKASVITATAVNPGDLSSCRKANLKSWIMKTLGCFL